MKISRRIFLVILLFTATHLQAQSSDSFVPIFEGKAVTSADFVDGETIVAQIEFIGLDTERSDEIDEREVYASDFIKLLREERTGLRENETFFGYKVFLMTKKLKEWLSEYGYEFAKVSALGMRVRENQMRLKFSVERGPLVATAGIRFVGNERISGAELVENLKGCLGNDWERYERRRYDYFAQKCSRSLMYSKGYFQAKILDIKSQVRDGVRNVLVTVAEGPRYRLGKVTIEGNRVLSDGAILESFGQKTGDVVDGRALVDFVLEKLKHKYDELGYVQYNADFEPDILEPRDWKLDGVVDVLITIDEGPKFKVRRIIFAGVPEDQKKSLVGEFLVKSGDIFSVGRLQNAIDKFNELERYEPLDKDQDVEFRTDEETAEVDLIITLRMPRQ